MSRVSLFLLENIFQALIFFTWYKPLLFLLAELPLMSLPSGSGCVQYSKRSLSSDGQQQGVLQN